MKDYYYILGVNSNCTAVEIREAYRKLSKKFHPDLNQNDAYFEGRFKDMQEAYETLSNPILRERYDAAFGNARSPRPGQDAPPKQKSYRRTTAVDVVFTIILISVTVLFGNYVWKAINGSKSIKEIKPVSAVSVPAATRYLTHHKRKRHLINKSIAIVIPKVVPKIKPVPIKNPSITASRLNNIAQKQSLKDNTVKAGSDTFKPRAVQVVNRPFKALQVSNKDDEDTDLPYSSYLRSNITGVINMHNADSFNSGVVAVIPANSKVLVLARGINYYKVQYNGDIGYVPKWTVKTK